MKRKETVLSTPKTTLLWHGNISQTNSGRRSAYIYHAIVHHPKAVDRESTIAAVSKGSSGYCGPGHNGVSYRPATAVQPPVGDDTATGPQMVFFSNFGGSFSPTWTAGNVSVGRNVTPTAPLPRRKKGLQNRSNQAWQGHKSDACDRWSWHPARDVPRFCLASRGEALGANA